MIMMALVDTNLAEGFETWAIIRDYLEESALPSSWEHKNTSANT